MDISKFISYFKEEVSPPVLDIYRQFENVIEAKTGSFTIPTGDHPNQKFVHGKIFESCVNQAANGRILCKTITDEFISLFPDFCKNHRNIDQYFSGMKQAGSVAWNVVRYMQMQHVSFSFGKRIENEHFTMLKPNLLVDFIQPTLIYDFKFSTLKSADEYEKKYLVNGLIQVLIYHLCLGKSPENVRLGVLVYYYNLNKVVFYTSNVHLDGFCVKLLREKLTENKHSDDSDSDTMPKLEPLTLE